MTIVDMVVTETTDKGRYCWAKSQFGHSVGFETSKPVRKGQHLQVEIESNEYPIGAWTRRGLRIFGDPTLSEQAAAALWRSFGPKLLAYLGAPLPFEMFGR